MSEAYPVAAFVLLLSMLYLIAKPLAGRAARVGAATAAGAGAPVAGEDRRDDAGPDVDRAAGAGAVTADAVEQWIAERKRALGGNRCAGCGHACEEGDRFCRSCGAPLTAEPGVARRVGVEPGSADPTEVAR